MLLLDGYPLPPACCFRCWGNSTPVIDLQLDDDALEPAVTLPVERRGGLYLCRQCVGTMAQMLGYVSGDGVKALRARIEEVTARAESAEADNREMAAILDGYERADERRSRLQGATA